MNVSDKDLKEIISRVPDRNARQQLENIITRKIVKQIRCLGDCKGKVVGYIDNQGGITSAAVTKEDAGIRRHRARLDGQYGFLCKCGNDSSIAKQEEGIVGASNITRPDIEKVYGNLSKQPADYKEKNGKLEVDGFVIEEMNNV